MNPTDKLSVSMLQVEHVRALSEEQIRAEVARLEHVVDEAQCHIAQLVNALPLAQERAAKLRAQARHLEVKTFRLHAVKVECCSSGPDARGTFWVGVGPEGKLLAAYEFVRAGRRNKWTGRTLGNPLGGLAGTELEIELSRLYGDEVSR